MRQHFHQHEGIAARERVHGERLAAQLLSAADGRPDHEAHASAVVQAEKGEELARIRQDVVHRGQRDVDAARAQRGDLRRRVRRRCKLDVETASGEETLLLRDEDRRVRRAGEAHDVQGDGFGLRGERRDSDNEGELAAHENGGL